MNSGSNVSVLRVAFVKVGNVCRHETFADFLIDLVNDLRRYSHRLGDVYIDECTMYTSLVHFSCLEHFHKVLTVVVHNTLLHHPIPQRTVPGMTLHNLLDGVFLRLLYFCPLKTPFFLWRRKKRDIRQLIEITVLIIIPSIFV